MSSQEPIKISQSAMTRRDMQVVVARATEMMKNVSVWKDPKAPAKPVQESK